MTGTTTGSRSTGVGTQPGTDTDESVAQKAQSAVSTATEKAKETRSELTHMASDQVDTAAHKLADRADERKVALAEQARTLQDKAREFARSIADEQPKVGDALEQATDSAGRFISYVESTPVEQMTKDLREQARKRPALFAAGMFGLGFALTRVLKPVDPVLTTGSSTGGSLQLGQGTTQPLPTASAVDGGLH